jgi:hypothetical protein
VNEIIKWSRGFENSTIMNVFKKRIVFFPMLSKRSPFWPVSDVLPLLKKKPAGTRDLLKLAFRFL